MSIQVKTKIDPKRMAEELKEKHQAALEKALVKAARQIDKRTRSGVDVDGNAFAPYSEDYRKFKQRKGRKGGVDLTFTGDMLRAISTKIERAAQSITGIIKFNSAGAAAKALGNMKKRKFFALSDEQVNEITEAIRKAK